MDNKESIVFDNIGARLGERFTDYIIIARPRDGVPMLRASDPIWAEGAARLYVNYCQTGNHLAQMDEFYRRNG